MKIGILTGGGDVPGLNPCIKAAVYRAIDEGHEIVGIRRGWGGLLDFNPDDPSSFEENIWPLTKRTVRKIDRTGGTFLHSSRTNPSKVSPSRVPDFLKDPEHMEAEAADKTTRDFTPHVLRNLQTLGIDVFFCDPRSPWQRGSNENTNGLLRQYFPRGTDLSQHSAGELDAVAHAMNTRPRKTLGWKTPAEMLDQFLASE